jgi:RES domain-containing protein
MLAYADLMATLPALPVHPFSGTLYRAVNYAALHGLHGLTPFVPDALYSGGATARGARFTPVGGPSSIYLAEDRKTADLEANQPYYLVQSINPAAVPGPPPTVLFTAKVELERVLDVSDPRVQAALVTNSAELTAAWRTLQQSGQLIPTQELGKAVFETLHAQAIRYPSAVPGGGSCVVIFSDLLAPNGYVEIYDPGSAFARRIP